MKANLIASRYECPRCKKEMHLQERKGTVDGLEWRCRSQSKDNPHDVVRSVRKGTWFSESKLAITIILRLTRYWFGKSMNAFVVNDDLTVTSWWMTIFMNSLHPSQGCIPQRNMTKCKRKAKMLARRLKLYINCVYGSNTVTANYVQFWFRRFSLGIFVIKDALHTGRPVVENVDKITEIIQVDRQISSRSITQEHKNRP
ncbi:uncharacterized protein TNCV_2518201 [Trichonephila clavipes]|nr:uncharacterized protein TNCV_2518201 [Trichonephila clavipes]